MKRRQFLKMIPIGVLSAFIPVKSEPVYITKGADICRGKPSWMCPDSKLYVFGDEYGICKLPDESCDDFRVRLLDKIKEPVTYT